MTMEFPEKQTSSFKLWLTGIGSVTSYAFIAYLIVFAVYSIIDKELFLHNPSSWQPHPIWNTLIYILAGVWFVSSLILTAYYIYNIFKNERLPNEKRVFWLLMIVLLNSFAFIVYWIIYLYPLKSIRSKRHNSIENALERWKLITAANSDVGRNIRIKMWITGIGSCLPFASFHIILLAIAFDSIREKWFAAFHPSNPIFEALPIIWAVFFFVSLYFLKFYFLYDLAFFRDEMNKMQKTAWAVGLLFTGGIVLPSYWYNVVYKRLTIDQDNY